MTAPVLVDCFFYKFYMDRKEFIKYKLENIPERTSSRKYLVGDVDRTVLNYGERPENKVVYSIPRPKMNEPRAPSDDNRDGHPKSNSQGTDVNVSNVSNSSLPTPPILSESFVRRHSSLNLLISFE